MTAQSEALAYPARDSLREEVSVMWDFGVCVSVNHQPMVERFVNSVKRLEQRLNVGKFLRSDSQFGRVAI